MKNIFKLVVAGALCAMPSIAQACSCAPPPAPKIALEQSAAVFVGRITSVEKLQTGNQYTSSNRFQFTVSKKWKGVQGAVATVVSNGNSAACGIVFDRDRDYLVYAFKIEGNDQLQTNLCTRTKRVSDAAADLAELGAPMKEAPPTQLSGQTSIKNGVIQINAPLSFTDDSSPLPLLLDAIKANESVKKFRLNWKFGQRPFRPAKLKGDTTALYNRTDSTLKLYSKSEFPNGFGIVSVLYSDVTDQMLTQLKQKNQAADETALPLSMFDGLTELGATKKDVGSRMIKMSA